MSKISAVVITLNEERNIERCILSLKPVADEILVLDSFSTDKTKQICEKHNVTFVSKEWLGYSASKNFANKQAKYDWIFSIDADEEISSELQKDILKHKKEGFANVYELSRITNYCGKWINHGGWYPDKKIRLFNRKEVKWVGDIHETLTVNGLEIIQLKGKLNHYSYYSVSEHINQFNKFTEFTALETYNKKGNSSIIKLFVSPSIKFIKDYFLKLGFLDGYYGFVIAANSAFATFLKYQKVNQLHREKTNSNK